MSNSYIFLSRPGDSDALCSSSPPSIQNLRRMKVTFVTVKLYRVTSEIIFGSEPKENETPQDSESERMKLRCDFTTWPSTSHLHADFYFFFFVQKHCKLVKLQPMHLHVERLIYVFIKKYWINASLSLSFSLLAFPSKKSQFIEYSARQKNTSKRISPLVQIRRAGLQFDF